MAANLVSLLTVPPSVQLSHIFIHLSAADLGRLSQVCKALWSTIQDESLWKTLCQRDFGMLTKNVLAATKKGVQTWKKIYQQSLQAYQLPADVCKVLTQDSPQVWKRYQKANPDLILCDFYVINSVFQAFWTLSRSERFSTHKTQLLSEWRINKEGLTLHQVIWFFRLKDHRPFSIITENNLNQLIEKVHKACLDQKTQLSKICEVSSIHRAAQHGKEEWLPTGKKLRKQVNRKDLFGNTALHEACFGGHLAIVKKLLEAGADPHQVNMQGVSPLDIANRSGNQEIINLF